MERIVMQVLSQIVKVWRGTAEYKAIIHQLALVIEQQIPDHTMEPQMGLLLIDLGNDLLAEE